MFFRPDLDHFIFRRRRLCSFINIDCLIGFVQDAKEDEKSERDKLKLDDPMDPMNNGGKRGAAMKRRGNTRIMSPTGTGISGGMMPPGSTGLYGPGPNSFPVGGGDGYNNMNNYSGPGGNPMNPGASGATMGQQQMNYGGGGGGMGYGGGMAGGPPGGMAGGTPMQNIPGSRFPSPGMPQTKQALQVYINQFSRIDLEDKYGPVQCMHWSLAAIFNYYI